MRTPVVLLTGFDPDAMATTMVSLQFDLPYAVAVRHHIDVDRQVLERPPRRPAVAGRRRRVRGVVGPIEDVA